MGGANFQDGDSEGFDMRILVLMIIGLLVAGNAAAGKDRGWERDGFQGSNSWTDELPAAGKAGHKVRLNQSGRDLEIRFEVSRIQPDRNASWAFAQIRMRCPIGANVVFHSAARGNLRP